MISEADDCNSQNTFPGISRPEVTLGLLESPLSAQTVHIALVPAIHRSCAALQTIHREGGTPLDQRTCRAILKHNE